MSEDANLIEKALRGDYEAFGRLVQKYRAPTVALAFQRVGNAAVADDIAQDAFVASLGKLHQLKDKSRFPSWLRSITLHACGMWLRCQDRTRHFYRSPKGKAAAEPVFDVEALIGNLPKGLRAAAVLCFEEDLRPCVAAAELGIKASTLRKRLHDARAHLQRQIVEMAEKAFELHLLPRDFAERCICRCEKARGPNRKEVRAMAKEKDCGCGCLGPGKGKQPAGQKPRKK